LVSSLFQGLQFSNIFTTKRDTVARSGFGNGSVANIHTHGSPEQLEIKLMINDKM
jgi:hypothetical protein